MKEQWFQRHINIFLSLENPCNFLLAKEKTWRSIFNANSELLQNCTKKQIMPLKTTVDWLFNDIWRYLIIALIENWRFSANSCKGLFFLIGIHSMEGWTATTRHGVTRKRSTKRLQHRRNLFRKNKTVGQRKASIGSE